MTACPTPSKHRYATREAAESTARRIQAGIGQILNPYPCGCDWWHLTSQDITLPEGAKPRQADVDRLVAMTDLDFRAVVKADATGKAGRNYRLALRHRDNLRRWKHVLGELTFDLGRQFDEKAHDRSIAAHDWRKRARGYWDALAQRRDECGRLRQQAALDAGREAKAAKAAMARLIEAHGAEFSRYLAEETARLEPAAAEATAA
ncbi:hypothetical protein OG539_32630 [Actinacidiphila glaucinigra]|uniref:hypothetical protein n=1 Tax=Actinacidiphila glaucinigra TaxID=235986 RepID=UPI00324DBF87